MLAFGLDANFCLLVIEQESSSVTKRIKKAHGNGHPQIPTSGPGAYV